MQKAEKILPAVGRNKETGVIENISNFLFIRKGIEKNHIKSALKEYKFNPNKTKYAIFVSSPYIYVNELVPKMSHIWLHPFREPYQYLPKQSIVSLISESDFVDSTFVPFCGDKGHKWDYFYFTLGGDDGVKFKGFSVFKRCLPVLKKMKGIVIIYGKVEKMKKDDIKLLKNSNITLITNKISQKQMACIASSCRFGLFPNVTDCSPRILTETIIRNKPILVYENILGGWKYVNENTGSLFSENNIGEKVDYIMSNKFSPRDDFMSKYGFVNSSKTLASFLGQQHEFLNKYDMIFFSVFKNIMKHYQ